MSAWRTGVMLAVGVTALGPGLAPRAARADEAGPVCGRVTRAIDGFAESSTITRTLWRIAPGLSPKAVHGLIDRAQRSGDGLAFDLYVALGLSHEADALRVLLEQRLPSKGPLGRLGRSLALLAMGDASETGTISAALTSGPVEVRRRVARALERMKQRRPKGLLQPGLDDADVEVRFYAARALIRSHNRAHRVIAAIAREGSPRWGRKAGLELLDSGYRFPIDRIDELPVAIRSVAFARGAYGRRSLGLERELRSSDQELKAGALAILALGKLEPQRKKQLVRKFTSDPLSNDSAIQMSRALSGEADAFERLAVLDRDSIARAVAVLRAYASTGSGELEEDHARRLARIVEGWIVGPKTAEDVAADAVRALAQLDEDAAIAVARARLLGPDGRSLRAAVHTLGKTRSRADLARVVGVAERKVSERTRVAAYLAARRICAP